MGRWVGDGGGFKEARGVTRCDRNRQQAKPGKPQQNAYAERFNRTVRHMRLTQYYFDNLVEFQDFATRWMWPYNH